MKGYKKGKSKRETDAIGGAMPGKAGEAARGIMRRRASDRLKNVMGEMKKGPGRNPSKGTYSK